MANIKKFGEAVVVTSAATLEDLKKIAKYKPEALALKEENDEGVKEEIFRVGVSRDRHGSISTYGIEFGGASDTGLAQVTVDYVGPEAGVAEALADSMGRQIVMLNKLEAKWPDVLDEIDADIDEVMSMIEVG